MTQESIFFLLFSILSVAISSTVAVMFWRRRNAVGAAPLSVLMLSAAIWTLTDLISVFCSELSLKIFWNNVTYIGIVIVPITWFSFSMHYTRREKYLTAGRLALLSVIPAITLILVFTNDFHYLFKQSIELKLLSPGSPSVLVSEYGIWFWIHTLYSYILIMTGTVILISTFIKLSHIYRKQAVTMTLAVLCPLIGNVLFVLRLSPSQYVDPTAFSFTGAGVFFFWGLFRYKLLDLVPAAREAIIESMEDLIIVLDMQDRIIDINTAAKKVFGKNQADLSGQPISAIFDNTFEQFRTISNSFKTNEKMTIRDIDGTKTYDIRIFPLVDNKGTLSGRFFVMRDITALEQAMVDLENSRKAAEEASKAKSNFLAAMSHEIRTPMNGILGMTELLSSAKLSDDEQRYLRSIEYSTNSLLKIINDVLDFSKIEAGKMELECIPFNIDELLSNTIEMFTHQKIEKSVSLEYILDKNIPDCVMGDPVRLRQILVNLIGNAFKFTKQGSVKVAVEYMQGSGNIVPLRFSVSDTGIGIQEENIGKLFNSFQQLDSSTTRKYGGTGLGLSIVKNLLDLMGGSIKVASNPGAGSTFTFIIPFRAAKSETKSDSFSIDDLALWDGHPEILLVEDNAINQFLMQKLLEKKNCRVDTASNGRIAIEKYEQKQYDIILMDIQMPEMDGFEAAAIIRETEKTKGRHTPVIALTANATEEDRNRCMQSGMDDYLSKPVKSEVLFTCLQKFLVK